MLDETTEEEFAKLLEGMQVVPAKPEYRLYYDDNGKVLFYTCNDKPEGHYLVIDRETYAESRHDIRVIDRVILRASEFAVVSKLERSDVGTTCAIEDISIIVSPDYQGKTQTWKSVTNEYKYS